VPPRKSDTPIPPIVTALATVLREARHEADLTQGKLAERAGISMRYVALLEKGEYQPSITVLHGVATALDMPLSELIRRAEEVLEADKD